MSNNRLKIKSFIASSIIVIIAFAIIFLNVIPSQADSFSVIEDKLNKITEEEKEILQKLFTLTEEIEEIEKEERVITKEIESVNGEINELEILIIKEEKTYSEKQKILKAVLRSYQRGGPGSYLEILLNSDNLNTFLKRLNTLRDITRNTGELLEALEQSKAILATEKEKLENSLSLVEEKKKKLSLSMAEKSQIKKEMENYLESLQEERVYYQNNLSDIQEMWEKLKPLFIETTQEFSRIVEEGKFPPDTIKTSFSFLRVTGVLDEETFNNIIKEKGDLPEMKFSFQQDKVTISMPEQNLQLFGEFVIVEKNTLKFQAEAGKFYGISLGEGSIKELFKEGAMVLNLEPLLGGGTIKSIDIKEGALELIVIPKLF